MPEGRHVKSTDGRDVKSTDEYYLWTFCHPLHEL